MNDISAKVEDLYMGVQSARTSMSDILTTLTDVSANMALTRKGVSSLQEIGSQIKTLLPTFPRELRGYLRTVLRYNMHMYFTLLDIQKNIATAPTQQLQSNFKFEDALGVTRELPYEWFRHWEPFEGLLRSQFQNTPGEDKVLEGKYLIVHANRPTVAINKGNWGNCITPGAEILMLIVMESISWHVTSCPRPTCDGRPTLDFSGGVMACCPKCGLKYLPQKLLSGPGQDQNISDAIQVLESQIVEDAEVFGHRPLPGNLVGEDLLGVNAVEPSQQDMNAPDMDRGATEPSNIPFLAVKASPSNGSDHASHFPVAEDTGQASDNTSPLHFGPIGGRDHDEEPATGAAPIMRWLQDTSPPEQSTSLLERQREKDQAQQRALEQEANNLEAIRNVFISNAPCPPPDHELASEGMPFGARIYYRNIIDRYPDVPKYLARRLAEANWNRANRLAKVKFPNLANFEEYWREDDTWADESSASTWGEINILQSPADCDPSEREMHRLEAKLAQTINEEGPYERHQHQCTDCFTTFPAIRLLRLHQVLKHSSPGKHTCLECPSSFEDERLYYYHWHLEHSDIANTCPICPAKAQDRHSLEEHIQKEHENSICAAFFQKEDPEAAESAAGRTDDGAPLSPKSAVQTADGIPPMQSEHPKSSDLIQKSESALAKLFGWNLDVLLKGLEKRPATEEPPSQKAPSGWEEAHYPYIADAMRSRVHNETAPDYWTGSRRRHSRSASLYSSRNSSLHGSDQFDAREQSMIIYNPVSDSDGGEFDFQLPSPPVPLGAITRFICDICGKELEIRRKRDWRSVPTGYALQFELLFC
ncbi:hypothetical protein A1O3_04861 [Capronia epimyces CBS 606.96]|uniref:C2H2-type domain-containing protein n=1 Tax=Capronia epimyces CBS 606.96 TaxID=1182542 RepID=W9YPK2_9EURO|nr:uncharacterized protein A1O3_04861 [Capronia epimyces CBS 606.96]EXJ84194.1 hypothetical protein A1O3_04861 [Capronia epimyces CBS 606.96]